MAIIEKVYEIIDDFRKEVKTTFVTVDRFTPVEKLVYGLVGLILTAVVGGLVMFYISLPK